MALKPIQQVGVALAAGTALLGVGYVGSRQMRQPGEVAFAPSGYAKVHVAGAVEKPCLYELSGDARVSDAIQAAGGATEDADPGQLNLAERVVDGAKIHVPEKGEVLPAPLVQQPEASASQGKKAAPGEPVSLSTATQAELESVPGIGPVTAQRIIQRRAETGGFKSVDELLSVKGIGEKKLAQMRAFLKP